MVSDEMRRELVRLCMPVVAYMRKTCTPHDVLIVTDGQVRMVSDEFSEPVSGCADREAASGTDARNGPSTGR